jgi:TonB-dependent starch-binding outer membrane protein SusC
MRKIIPLLMVGLLLAGYPPADAQSNVYASAQLDPLKKSKNLQTIELKTILSRLEQRYRVSFMYKSNLKDIRVTNANDNEFNTVADQLDFIFKSTPLMYKKVDEGFYIILKKEESGKEKSARHSGSIEKVGPINLSNDELKELINTHTTVNNTVEKIISGKVTDNDGNLMPGVNIVVKGTAIGTVTDAEGNYTLKVPNDAGILVFSFIGFTPVEVAIGTQTTINVTLTLDIQQLQEIVVIGYGEVKKSDLTGAVGAVSEDELRTVVKTSFEQSLQGRVAGVLVTNNSGQPGGGVSLRIRGTSSINSTNEPLYVVDGVPIDGDARGTATGFDWAGGGNGQTAVSRLASINPDDIVSVNVLKDASAQAIYGSRAANGVVIITTKRGQSGESKISYSSYTGVQQLGKTIEVMNLQEYAAFVNEAYDAIGRSPKPAEFADPSLLGEGTNWQKEIYQSAAIQNHNIGFTGGNEKSTYSISTGYFDQDGVVIGTNFKRYSMRVNLDSKVKDWFKIGNSFTFSHTNQKITLTDQDDGVVAVSLVQGPDVPVRNVDGSWAGPVVSGQNSTFDNPVAKANDRNLGVKRYQALGNIFAEATILKKFVFRTELGGDLQLTNNYAFIPTYNYGPFNVNTVNKSRRDRSESIYWIWKNYLTYTTTFADRHNVTAMAGHEAQSSTWESLSATRFKFQSNDANEINAGDASTAQNSGTKGDWAMESYFGRVIYNFDDRYLFTGTFRADASSNFGPNYKWAYFPSMAVKWNITNESFLSNINHLDLLSVRLGYGETGNQNIPGYQYGASIGTRLNGLGSVSYADKIANPNIRWETTKQFNIGLDLGLLGNRVQLTADYYVKNTDDALMQQSLPDYLAPRGTGNLSAPWVNLGSIQNKGVELTLTTRNLQGALTWGTTVTFTSNRNKVVSLGDGVAPIDGVAQWTNVVSRTTEGKPIGSFYGYVIDGIFLTAEELLTAPSQSTGSQINRISGTWIGDYRFKNYGTDGVVDATDRQFIGNPQPDFSFGINNTFEYRNFDLSVYLQGTYGNDLFNFLRYKTESMRFLRDNQTTAVRDRAIIQMIDPNGSPNDPANWIVTNPGTDMPRHIPGDPNENARMSDRYVEDGSYMRIQNITLGYTLPKNNVVSKYINRLRVYGSVQNLHTFTKYTGYDPEVGAYNQDAKLTGVDNGRYPMPRTFTVGVNVEF